MSLVPSENSSELIVWIINIFVYWHFNNWYKVYVKFLTKLFTWLICTKGNILYKCKIQIIILV